MTPSDDPASYAELSRQVSRLKTGLATLTAGVAGALVWLALRTPALPPVVAVERLEVVEADGSLAFVLANSQRPVAATMDGQVLMTGQEEERRGVPSFVFFDGKGDEVGGMLLGVRETPDGYSAVRHLSLDGYEQDQTIVLSHNQDPDGSSAGLSVSDRPREVSMGDALEALGLQLGATRDELQAAVLALPEETRASRLRELFGVPRLFLGSARDRTATLTLRDGYGRPRLILEVPDSGEAAIRILDEDGELVGRLPAS